MAMLLNHSPASYAEAGPEHIPKKNGGNVYTSNSKPKLVNLKSEKSNNFLTMLSKTNCKFDKFANLLVPTVPTILLKTHFRYSNP